LSTARKFAGQTAIYGISTVVSRVLNFFLTPLYVRVYPAKAYGIFTTMYSWASLLNALLSFGMETTFFRYLHKYENDREKVYQNTFFSIALLAFSFFLFAFWFVDDIALWMQRDQAVYQPDYALYVKFFIYILVIDALTVIPFAKLRAEGRSLRYAGLKSLNVFLFIIFNLFFIFGIPYILENNLTGAEFFSTWYRPSWVGYVFISNLLASGITFLLLSPELAKLRWQIDIALLRDMYSYSWPVLVANISFIINENIDKILIGRLLPVSISQQEVGIYGATCKLAIFLSIFIQAFRLGAEPFFFSHAKKEQARQTYAKIMHYFVIAVCLICMGLVANLEILKYFIRGNAEQQQLYWSGLQVVPILLFAYISLGIYMNLSIWYKLSDQTRYGLYISAVGALLTIGLNIWLVPQYSYLASAWITLLAYATMMLLSYWLGQKNYPIPYPVKRIAVYLLLTALMVFCSFYLFKSDLLVGNILFALFVIGTLMVEQKGIRQLLKQQ